MTPQERLTKLIQIVEMLKEAYQELRTDALRAKKAMENYHQFIIHHYYESK